MGTDIMLQLRQAVLSLAAGAAAGLLYDIFAVLRTDSGLLGAVLLDGAFSLMAAAGLFALGYGPGEGELRLFMLLFMLAGMGVYFIVSGGRARRMMAKGCGMLARAAGFVLRPLKKLCIFLKKVKNFAKKLFQKLKKWYTLYRRTIVPDQAMRKDKGVRYETEKSRLDNENSRSCDSSLYGIDPCRHEGADRRGARGERPYCGSGEESVGGKRGGRVRNRAQHRAGNHRKHRKRKAESGSSR